MRTATDQLVDDLQGLGAPDTDSGEEVKVVARLALDHARERVRRDQDTVDGVSGITDIPSAITTITASLSRDGTAFSETLQTIENADAKGELQTALEDSPECADISS